MPAKSRKLQDAAFALLSLLALLWAVWTLRDAWPQASASLAHVEISWLVVPFVGTILAGIAGFVAFRILFERMQPAAIGLIPLARLYFIGQLMKHLPGRIWGVAYQAARGREVTLSQWASVNLVFMAVSTLFALWAASLIIGMALDFRVAIAIVMIGLALYVFAWTEPSLAILAKMARGTRLRAARDFADALQGFAASCRIWKPNVAIWLLICWLANIGSWAGYGLAWPEMSVGGAVQLCALYTLAWFAGYASVFAPSGIGVRELVFVALTSSFPPDAVAATLVFGRGALIVADIILAAPFFLPAYSGQNKHCKRQ